MYALFEEAGKFLAGRILSEAETSAQIELDSGKRVKAKAAHILLKFEKPAPAELMAQAQAVAATIELPLAWEFAPEEEFGFADLARDYFSASATLAAQVQRAQLLHVLGPEEKTLLGLVPGGLFADVALQVAGRVHRRIQQHTRTVGLVCHPGGVITAQ